VSRYIANKCSIAARLDCFADVPTKVFGEKLKQQVEDRLVFLKGGDKPPTNISVMEEALAEASLEADKKKKKKKKKRKSEANGHNGDAAEEADEVVTPKKKKKSDVVPENGQNGDSSAKKKKKKKKSVAADED